MKEQRIQKQILDYLNMNGCFCFKTIACNRSGIPDIIALYEGKFIAIEVKTDKGKISKLQEYNLDIIKDKGGYATVVYSVQEAKEFFKIILAHS